VSSVKPIRKKSIAWFRTPDHSLYVRMRGGGEGRIDDTGLMTHASWCHDYTMGMDHSKHHKYRGTSLIRNCPPPGPYNRAI